MAETANIAKMAEKLSKELFSEFLWGQVGPWNWNWPCEEANHKAKTHPSDVVFYYDEPYRFARTYVNCDLKSYAKGTIDSAKVGAAIESLARALTCAEKSKDWREKFIHSHISPEICGLLFVYNHDGEYDKDFMGILNAVDHDKLDIPKNSKIVVLGPRDIFWLNNIRFEIVQLRGTGKIPPKEQCHFFYPHLVRRKNLQPEKAKAATLEALTAPWLILSYPTVDKPSSKSFTIFYRRRGESVEEFLYLLDYLMHYQIITPEADVMIKTLDTHHSAHTFFSKAIDQYIEQCESSEEMKTILGNIKYRKMQQVITEFSELEIGMENV